jgi:hypothetical protein
VVYESTFDNGQPGRLEVAGWNSSGVFALVTDNRVGNFAGRTVVGKLNNNTVRVLLPNLPRHTNLRVEFDLYVHNNWQNNLWHLAVDGSDLLITGFSTDPNIKQSYPNWLGGVLNAAGTNAQETLLPGVCTSSGLPRGTNRYRIVSTILHSNLSADITCNDVGGIVNDR